MTFLPPSCPPGSSGGGGGGGGGNGDPGFDVENQILCDFDSNGEVVGSALVVYEYDAETGNAVGPPSVVDIVTGAPYVIQGTLRPCSGSSALAFGAATVAEFEMCDFTVVNTPSGQDIARVQFIRKFFQDGSGNVVQVVDLNLAGTPYTVQGSVAFCDAIPNNNHAEVLCDANGTQFLRWYARTGLTADQVASVTDTALDGTSFTPVAPIGLCTDGPGGAGGSVAEFVFCDIRPINDTFSVTTFVRKFIQDASGTVISVVDLDMFGNPYTVLGSVGRCPEQGRADEFALTFCDDNGPFLRIYQTDIAGNVVDFDDFTLDGDPYTAVGTVGNCTEDSAPDCCPATVGEVCLVGGHKGIIVRLPDGTTQHINQTIGGFFDPRSDVVPCATTDEQEFNIPLVFGEVCYVDSVPTNLSDNWQGASATGAAASPRVYTNNDFAGTGQTVTLSVGIGDGVNNTTGVASIGSLYPAHAGPSFFSNSLDLGSPKTNVQLEFVRLNGQNVGDEQLINFSPAFTGQLGGQVIGPNTGVRGASPNSAFNTVTVTFAGPVQVINFDYSDDGGNVQGSNANAGLRTISFTETASTTKRAVTIKCDGCDESGEGIQYFDVETGHKIDTITITECPPLAVSPVLLTNDTEIVRLCDDNTSFIRRYVFDENGDIDAVQDYLVDGTPYIPVGFVGECEPDTAATFSRTQAQGNSTTPLVIPARARRVHLDMNGTNGTVRVTIGSNPPVDFTATDGDTVWEASPGAFDHSFTFVGLNAFASYKVTVIR